MITGAVTTELKLPGRAQWPLADLEMMADVLQVHEGRTMRDVMTRDFHANAAAVHEGTEVLKGTYLGGWLSPPCSLKTAPTTITTPSGPSSAMTTSRRLPAPPRRGAGTPRTSGPSMDRYTRLPRTCATAQASSRTHPGYGDDSRASTSRTTRCCERKSGYPPVTRRSGSAWPGPGRTVSRTDTDTDPGGREPRFVHGDAGGAGPSRRSLAGRDVHWPETGPPVAGPSGVESLETRGPAAGC